MYRQTHAKSIVKQTTDGKPRSPTVAKLQNELAVAITRHVGRPGSSVLVFVSGMADILDLTERFENLKDGAVHYQTVAIHSEVPDEEQTSAFENFGESVN